MISFSKHLNVWEKCTRCPIHLTCSKVLYRGSFPCHVLFIGEAPGDTELALGKPFVGAAGKYLNYIIQDIVRKNPDYEALTFGFTNAIACGPMDEGLQLRKPTNTEIANCFDRLLECIELIDPFSIVALGEVAKKTMKKYDGNALVYYGIHPAAILRQGERGALDSARLVEVITDAFDNAFQG